jgi:nitrite reductase/ring-hydroxylating ferredoxin subunit
VADWTKVADVSDLATEGLGRAFKVAGLQISLFRWEQRVYALEDICPHMGFPLSEGVTQSGEVICNWHGWRIRLDDGSCRITRKDARSYPVEVRGEEVWVQV